MTIQAPEQKGVAADDARLRRLTQGLSEIDRPSASEGERVAAEWIVERFGEIGVAARIEPERVHGEYWVPLSLLTGAAAAAGIAALRAGRGPGRRGASARGMGGRVGRRAVAGAVAAAAAAGVWDDLTAGRRVFRRMLPARTAYNVVAEIGPRDATRTIVLVAHHDAAHCGLIFHPAIPAFVWRRFPALIEAGDTSPPVMFPVFGGPALVALGAALGSRRLTALGTIVSGGAPFVLADIGLRQVVPGANDNATGVVTLLEVARALVERPVPGLRVMLVSTGSEESILEGMQGFGRRHFPALPVESTFVLNIDTVGSPHLTALRGEGMLRMYEYPRAGLEAVDRAAEDLGVWLFPNLRLRNATDGLVALKAGYPSATLGSVTDYKAPANYHWPTDTAANVDYGTLADAIRLTESVVRRLGDRWV
jgi:acetylornithine deacetylase/succinyl-diaminopimelate desuccinylase-like protein